MQKKKDKETKKQKTIQAPQFQTDVRKTKQLMGVKNVYTPRKFTGFSFRNLIRCKWHIALILKLNIKGI